MFIGYYQLGDLVPISVWTLDANKAPTEPDDVPMVQVLDSSGVTILNKELPVVDATDITGYFQHRINLDQSFTVGYHSLIINYVLSSNSYAVVRHFEILAGGNDDGNGIAMHFFRQSSADYLLMQTDRGTLKRLKNPIVRGVS